MNCIICQSQNTKRNNKVVICENCGHAYRDFGKIDEKDYYTNQYRQNIVKQNESVRPPEVLAQRVENIYNIVKPFIKQDAYFLEVGVGEGFFPKTYKRHHDIKKYYCCEISELHAQEAKNCGLQVFNCGFQDIETDIKFDTIVSFDVLEHINNPYEYTEKLKTLLNPGGVAIIQVPTDRRLHSETPFDGHYHYFSRNSLKKTLGNDFNNLLFYKTQRGECAGGPEFLTAWKYLG